MKQTQPCILRSAGRRPTPTWRWAHGVLQMPTYSCDKHLEKLLRRPPSSLHLKTTSVAMVPATPPTKQLAGRSLLSRRLLPCHFHLLAATGPWQQKRQCQPLSMDGHAERILCQDLHGDSLHPRKSDLIAIAPVLSAFHRNSTSLKTHWKTCSGGSQSHLLQDFPQCSVALCRQLLNQVRRQSLQLKHLFRLLGFPPTLDFPRRHSSV
mmetsp:Transcript_78975/g.198452  ORF Transcript_78975/g.198452 Transcript_78975/m.198452 type:complete len:208 (-) Transcript_78975:966-1589(-)